MENLTTQVDALLAKIRRKYKEYGIKEKPFVMVKADNGTYGQGIMTVRDAKELPGLLATAGEKLGFVRDGVSVHDVIVQEGVETSNGCTMPWPNRSSTPWTATWSAAPTAVHPQRGVDENLNAPAPATSAGLCPQCANAPARPAPRRQRTQPLLYVRRDRPPGHAEPATNWKRPTRTPRCTNNPRRVSLFG